jgi:poly(3-hydroxybutyrate) depolymerase
VTPLDLPFGRGATPFVDEGNPDRPLTIESYRPAAYRPDDPIVFVQHGMMRNGDDYRDFWIPAAEKHRLLIVAPSFSNAHYPEPESYNNGLVFTADGALRARASWAYAALSRVFASLRASGVTKRARFHLFGHSAGGQFVHRLMQTLRPTEVETAISGNAGWYSLPLFDKAFPEGLGDIGLRADDARQVFETPLTILAGTADDDPNGDNLPRNPEAMRQGATRYARAHNFMAVARAEAARLGVPLGWRIVDIDGIGHDGRAMSIAAAALWFDGRVLTATDIAGAGTVA